MKKYTAPTAEVELFETVDVIATSTEDPTTTKSKDPYAVDKF